LIKVPQEETKKANKKKTTNMLNSRRSGNIINNNLMGDEDLDEVVDGDEGVINRRLPINSYNH